MAVICAGRSAAGLPGCARAGLAASSRPSLHLTYGQICGGFQKMAAYTTPACVRRVGAIDDNRRGICPRAAARPRRAGGRPTSVMDENGQELYR